MKKIVFTLSNFLTRSSCTVILFLILNQSNSWAQSSELSIYCTPYSVNILSGGNSLPFWSGDFLEDAFSPNGIDYNSFRLRIFSPIGTIVAGGTSGYPTPQPPSGYQLSCNHNGIGNYTVQLWGKDSLGNADYCTTTLVVTDNLGINCESPSSVVSGTVQHFSTQQGIQDVTITISGNSNIVGPFSYTQLVDGTFAFLSTIPSSYNLTITPSKVLIVPNTQGLSAYDIVLVQKHILGITPLSSPYVLMAADVNGSKTVTGADITEIKRFILGITTQLPNNRQFGFVPETYVFANAANPFDVVNGVIPSNIIIPVYSGILNNQDFIGFKYGDVSGDALLTNDVVEDRNLPIAYIQADDRHVQAGEVFEVKFQTAEAFTAYQFTMDLQGLEVAEIMPGEGMTSDDFAVLDATKTVTAVVAADETARTFAIRFKATRSGNLSEMIQATHNVTPSLAYNEDGKESVIDFRFGSATAYGLELYPSTPNPFMEATNIRFGLQDAAKVTLRIHDAYGRTLHSQTAQYAEGQHAIALTSEQVQAPGVFFYTLETENDKVVGQIVRIK